VPSPRIRYATTTDGFNIAYAVSGEGPFLFSLPSPPDCHIELELGNPGQREVIEELSRRHTLVRFDHRGTGLSDRAISEFTMETRLRDLEAVVRSVGAMRFDVLAGAHGAHLAVAYAAENPERVDHMVLVDPFARGIDFAAPERIQLLDVILHRDWQMFTDNVGAMVFGFGNELAPKYGAFFRDAVDHEAAIMIYGSMSVIDVTELLPQVQTPTLVLESIAGQLPRPGLPAAVAAGLPNAEFLRVNVSFADASPIHGHLWRFTGRDHIASPRGAPAPQLPAGTLRTILFTDIQSHSEMMSRLGDHGGRDVLRRHEEVTRKALRDHGGSEVKSMGDGFLASFGSAQAALECAISLQRELKTLCEDGGPMPRDFRVRIGINAGEPIAEDDDLFGASVIAASRIAAQAGGGEIVVADVVRQLAAGKGFLFSDRGEVGLRGLDDPVRLYEVAW
jgi:class 3 adenylate cyclase/pimeloyl-ACP methyl ester carboxylesterase